jgi:hypothetical protein
LFLQAANPNLVRGRSAPDPLRFPSWLRLRPPCFADTEAGELIEDPGHVEILGMLANLQARDNTFFRIYPENEDAAWSIVVRVRPGASGGYEIERCDAGTSEHTTTAESDHAAIASDVLSWISCR